MNLQNKPSNQQQGGQQESLLNGLRILNTRPQGQAAQLNQIITAAGGQPIPFPCIDIIPIPAMHWCSVLPPLQSIDQAIFTSINAVHCFFDGLTQQQIPWPQSIGVIAIGKKTAQALTTRGIVVHDTPTTADSEHLVSLASLQNIQQHNVLLIKGENGRTLIADTIKARGGNLMVVDVYRRALPKLGPNELKNLWRNHAIDMIFFTSEEAMHNLVALVDKQTLHWLQEKPCLVISERLAKAGLLIGFKNSIVCQLDTILETLQRLNQQGSIFYGKDK